MHHPSMDCILLKALHDAKALLDSGTITQEEFNREKELHLKDRDARSAAARAAAAEPSVAAAPLKRREGRSEAEACKSNAAAACVPSRLPAACMLFLRTATPTHEKAEATPTATPVRSITSPNPPS